MMTDAQKRAFAKYAKDKCTPKVIKFAGDRGKDLLKVYMDYVNDKGSNFTKMTKELIIERLSKEGYLTK